jgi:hypothetical protein
MFPYFKQSFDRLDYLPGDLLELRWFPKRSHHNNAVITITQSSRRNGRQDNAAVNELTTQPLTNL